MQRSLMATAAVLALAAAPAAHALPIVGGFTSVTLTAAPVLTAAGLSVAPLGSALVSPGTAGTPIAFFPITGGNLDTVTFAGGIAHAGSGLSLSSSSASVSLTNFFIDTVAGVLTGDVAFGSTALSSVPLFTLGSSGVATSPFSLTVTSAAGGALSAIFGIPNLTGAVLGNANTLPITAAVPEPATVASMLAGLALIGGVLGRRRGAARASAGQ